MSKNKEIVENTEELEVEINPFKLIAKEKPKKFIITRWLLFSIVTCILTVIVANVAPIDLNELEVDGVSEGELAALNIENVTDNPAIKKFMISIQGIIAFFTPIVIILLVSIGLKILTILLKPIFKESVLMKYIIIVSTMAYSAYFISNVLRLALSIYKKEYNLHSLGTLAQYFNPPNTSIFTQLIFSVDLFSILFFSIITFGLYSFSKAKLAPVAIVMAVIFFISLLGEVLLLTG